MRSNRMHKEEVFALTFQTPRKRSPILNRIYSIPTQRLRPQGRKRSKTGEFIDPIRGQVQHL